MSVIVKEEGKTVAIFGKFKDSLELLAKSVVPECKGEIFLTVKDNPRYLFKIAEVENAKPIPLDSGELVEVRNDVTKSYTGTLSIVRRKIATDLAELGYEFARGWKGQINNEVDAFIEIQGE